MLTIGEPEISSEELAAIRKHVQRYRQKWYTYRNVKNNEYYVTSIIRDGYPSGGQKLDNCVEPVLVSQEIADYHNLVPKLMAELDRLCAKNSVKVFEGVQLEQAWPTT